MTAQQLQDKLTELDACNEAREWAKDKDLKTAWDTCERGDWMIWLLTESQNEVTDRELRLIAVECCRSVQHLMTDERSINAVNVAERYANGEATDEELQAAWEGAGDAWAARARAARAAWAAAGDAWEAAWAAGDARAGAGEAENKKQAYIVRKIVPTFKFK